MCGGVGLYGRPLCPTHTSHRSYFNGIGHKGHRYLVEDFGHETLLNSELPAVSMIQYVVKRRC